MSPLAQLAAAGIAVERLPEAKLRAAGFLTDEIHEPFWANKAAILAEPPRAIPMSPAAGCRHWQCS